MNRTNPPVPSPRGGMDVSRRRFVQGLALGSVAASAGLLGSRPVRATSARAPVVGGIAPSTLSGTEFALEIGQVPVNFTGTRRLAHAINGFAPGPLLRWKEGSEVTCT